MSSSSSTISVKVTNQLDVELIVYNTQSEPVTDPPSSNPDDYYPIYTKLGTVPANGTNTINTGEILSRLVIARATDDFPVKLFVPNTLGALTQPVTVAATDQTDTETAFKFYQQYISQPYAPLSLQFNEIILNDTNLDTLDSQISTLLQNNGYPGADYYTFSMVSYWAANSLYAWSQTYYCYEPEPANSSGFILPTTSVGQVVIENGTAEFIAADGGGSESLTFSQGCLSSANATSSQGIKVTSILRDLTWEGQSSEIEMFWVGTKDGKQFIVQPYETPELPWWIIAYDMAFATYLGVQIVMIIDMATHVLQGVSNGIQWLSENVQSLYSKMRSNNEDISSEADPDAAVGDDVDPINVDVDVDVDVDTDVVTDTDNVTDTDTDVDIDVDIDVDDDVCAVWDVDVDVDVDIDTDVVTDTDNVTDTDTDVDVDIDTDVDVEPGGIKNLLNKIGNWIMTKGFPALAKNLAIMGAMTGAQQLLQAWQQQDEQDLANMSPQETTGMGLLLNYMLKENNSIQERWTTYADYVQQQEPDISSQQVFLSSILMFKNTAADTAQSNWRWPQSAEDSLINEMAQYTSSAEQYQAYLKLAVYTYQNQPLPIKVGASVAINYLVKIS